MDNANTWNDVLGPFYSEASLLRHGFEETDNLIALRTSDGIIVYPHAQFDTIEDQKLQRREKVLELWNTLIRPAIDEGIVDEWTATGLLLQGTENRPSEADIISSDETQVERVTAQIYYALSRFRQ